MRLWLVLLVALPLLAVGSGATASGSAAPQNGLIAVRGGEGILLVDPRAETAVLVPKTEELSEPEWSPDGTRLAVSSWGAAEDSVYTMKPDGSDRTLVLRNAYSPAWSPDGSRLVVVRDNEAGSSLAIVDADGSNAAPIAGTSDASVPKWSPDGKRIAFVDGNGKIGLISPDGETLAMPAITAGGSVSWSPDSTKLAYDRYKANDKDAAWSEVVAVLDLASGKETLLSGEPNAAETPVWSPEGDQIVFHSMSLGKSVTASCGSHVESQLWLMAADGTKAHRIGKGFAGFGVASWGRAAEPAVGNAPLPARSTPVKAIPRTSSATPPLPARPTPVQATPPKSAPTPEPKVSAKPAKPVAATKLEPLTGADGLIAVRGKGGIYLVDPSAGKTREIPGTAEMWAPAWSPTMKELAVQKSEKGGGSSVYTIRPDGTHARLVLENASAPSWSAAGDRILAIRNDCTGPCDSEDDAANVLYAVNADGTGAQRVDFDDSDAYTSRELAWPVDGSAIHFFDDESLSGPGSFDSSSATWSPDETQLAFTGALGPSEDETESNGLWIVSAEGGTPTLLLSNAVGRPSWAR